MLAGFYPVRRRNYDPGLVVAFVGVFAPLLGLNSLGYSRATPGLSVSRSRFSRNTALMRSRCTPDSATEPAMEIARELS